ncbi:tryptophanyl-tRNA synthetase [Microsporum canis CBS 113480]|uniref:Tryptophan--tRNA ligase, cytoplasmic n=1 Tax=Arthroderma otae (strain ATCC MYA-4605 / CBS 113480) TaxID=554155 RepID=C5FHG0_ARTOC|nr:tryptophanyl-tRNA synthetase [Microsporum canis CBS 113480]EEQ28700.1 tryptophanyl-tRNA synthetase [Microsporum canis CBS 113480]
MEAPKAETVVPVREEEQPAATIEQEINPWDVKGAKDAQGNTLAFDYVAISKKWATKLIDDEILQRFERLTGHKPHRWLRRGLFFSHRDFDKILDKYEYGEPFFLYTGRGPSSDALHLGHTIPFAFTKWLQDVFDVPLVIMLTDDEKALFKEKLTFEETYKFGLQNAKDIIACGFDLKKTFIYSDLEYIKGPFLTNVWEFSKLLTFNQVRGAFGFNESAAAFATSYPEIWADKPATERTKAIAKIQCLIPMAIDQDPYFRLLRENSHRMRFPSPKPALIHSQFLTALQGAGGKMSASDPNSAIFMSDTPNQIKKKIRSYAFSGGRETVELHHISYFEDDDEKLKKIEQDYRKGDLLTGELKQIAINLLQEYVKEFQDRRKTVTDEVLKQFMTPRKLEWNGNPNPIPRPVKHKEAKAKDAKPQESKPQGLQPQDK